MRHGVSLAAALTVALGTAVNAAAQAGRSKAPLVLREQGSFFVGGRTIHTDAVSGTPGGLLGTGNGGSITVDQMYVQYQIPEDDGHHLPVVLLHGCCLSGKTYETTRVLRAQGPSGLHPGPGLARPLGLRRDDHQHGPVGHAASECAAKHFHIQS